MYSATSQGTVQFGHDFGLIRSMVHTSALCSKMVTFLMFMATLSLMDCGNCWVFNRSHTCISTELTHLIQSCLVTNTSRNDTKMWCRLRYRLQYTCTCLVSPPPGTGTPTKEQNSTYLNTTDKSTCTCISGEDLLWETSSLTSCSNS